MLEGYRIICFGDEEWSFTGTVQRIARTLATKNEMVYVTSLGIRRPRLSGKDFLKMARRTKMWISGDKTPSSAVRIITPLALPLYESLRLTRFSGWLVYEQLRRAGVFPPTRKTLLWVALPTAAPILEFLGHPHFFYHATDRQCAYPGANRAVIQTLEHQLAMNARFCVASSRKLMCELKRLNPRSFWLDHGVDFAHFEKASNGLPPELRELPRPVIGYLGGITEWVDLEAIAALAKQRPQWTIVLVGKCYVDIQELLKFTNVHWLGPRPYPEVPHYIAGFDVCLLPRTTDEWEMYSNPLKLLEYFCIGRPVVSSALPGATSYGQLVYVYQERSEIVGRVEEALRESTGLQEQRRQIARSKAHPYEVEELSAYVQQYYFA